MVVIHVDAVFAVNILTAAFRHLGSAEGGIGVAADILGKACAAGIKQTAHLTADDICGVYPGVAVVAPCSRKIRRAPCKRQALAAAVSAGNGAHLGIAGNDSRVKTKHGFSPAADTADLIVAVYSAEVD